MSDTAAADADLDAQAADEDAAAQAADVDAQGGAGGSESLSKEEARKLRSEHRALRQREKALKEELDKLKEAELSTTQKLERDLAAANARTEQAEAKARNADVKLAAAKLGVRPDAVDLVVNSIDWESIEDATDGKQVERAIRELVKEKPFLSAKPAGLDGGNGRGAGGQDGDMNQIIRRAAGRA